MFQETGDDQLDSAKLYSTLDQVGSLLVAGDYQGLTLITKGRRLTAEELRQAVLEYGRQLVRPPEWRTRSLVPIEGEIPHKWSAYFDLYTLEEGLSDLTLELILIDSGNETYDVEIDNLHVL